MRARINPALPLIEKPLPEDDPMQRKPVIDLLAAVEVAADCATGAGLGVHHCLLSKIEGMSGPVILVTGGAGYIGSHAVRALQHAGHRWYR